MLLWRQSLTTLEKKESWGQTLSPDTLGRQVRNFRTAYLFVDKQPLSWKGRAIMPNTVREVGGALGPNTEKRKEERGVYCRFPSL